MNLVAAMSGADPFPALHTLRDDNPVAQVELPNGARIWLVTRYEDARQAEQVRTAVQQLVAYIVNLLVDKRSSPGDDLLSALVDVREDSDRLSEDELESMVFLIGAPVDRFQDLRLAAPAENLQWRLGILIRGLVHLPVRLS